MSGTNAEPKKSTPVEGDEHECLFPEEQEECGRLILAPCLTCGLAALDALAAVKADLRGIKSRAADSGPIDFAAAEEFAVANANSMRAANSAHSKESRSLFLMIDLARVLRETGPTMEAERDAALAVVAGVAAVIAKLAEHIDNPEDISEYWREAFDATDDIEDILSEASK